MTQCRSLTHCLPNDAIRKGTLTLGLPWFPAQPPVLLGYKPHHFLFPVNPKIENEPHTIRQVVQVMSVSLLLQIGLKSEAS